MEDPLAPLRRAVTRLVEDPNAGRLYSALVATVPLAHTHPVRLIGEAEDMNALVELAHRDARAYRNVLDLVARKRAAAGLAPLAPPEDQGFDKAEYMRDFMAAKRARLVRAASLENRQRPERDRLVGRARLDFMDHRAAEWKRELDDLFARTRQAQGRRLPKDVADTLRSQFWAAIDKRLDEQEALLKQRSL